MTKIGTTFTKSGKKAVLCGSGELGKEVALELQRYGVEVVALDKYENAPAMHIAHRSHVLSMLDGGFSLLFSFLADSRSTMAYSGFRIFVSPLWLSAFS